MGTRDYITQAQGTGQCRGGDGPTPSSNVRQAHSGSLGIALQVGDHSSFGPVLAVVGIQNSLRPSVREAVKDCQHAGAYVCMVTGGNVLTAEAIAEDCGIFTPGSVVIKAPSFCNLSESEIDTMIPRLCVLARYSPEDKRRLVKRLQELGETVAVTGDGANDVPALKAADVGFSMCIAGTKVAKEASAITLMDDNLASIVKALLWGRRGE
jgi:Ca2+-transporting ATPase